MSEALALPWPTMVVRLLVAFVLGGIIGLERERRERPAGLRTHILVTVASALLMMISGLVAGDTFDPGRIAAAAVTGIGFLGAGTIIRYGGDVRGLTTAATIWAAAAVGLTVGLGWYAAALCATLLIFFTLTAMHRLEGVLGGASRERHVLVQLVPGGAQLCGDLLELLREAGVHIAAIDFEGDAHEQLVLHCRIPRRMHTDALLDLLAARDEVLSGGLAS